MFQLTARRWYPPLAAFTFPSNFVSLSVEDARSFIRYQERLLSEFHITDGSGAWRYAMQY
jgi:hypothetical protein